MPQALHALEGLSTPSILEMPYVYQPFVGSEDDNRFNEATRKRVLEGYHHLNQGI